MNFKLTLAAASAGLLMGLAVSAAPASASTFVVPFAASSIAGDPTVFSISGDFVVENAPGHAIDSVTGGGTESGVTVSFAGLSPYAAATNNLPPTFGGISINLTDGGAFNDIINLFKNGSASAPSYFAVFNSVDPVGNASSGEAINLTVGAVPEPGVWAMMLVGFGGLGMAMRSRRRQALAA